MVVVYDAAMLGDRINLGLVRQRAAATGPRVERLAIGGTVLWVKRAERLRGFDRFRKRSPSRCLAREASVLRAFAEVGAPVPSLVLDGEDFIVIRDGGESVAALLPTLADPQPLLIRAGEALANLHALGLAHGRPALRDMLWDGGTIRFIDFERPPRTVTDRARALDLLIFHHSLLRWLGKPSPLVDVALGAFVAADAHDTWGTAAALCCRHRWIATITRPFHGRGGRGNDLRPLGWLFDRMLAPPPGVG